MKLKPLSLRLFLSLMTLLLAVAAYLRISGLNHLPASLYWEEAALGYDAYSIAQTGKDHHGQPFPVVAFTSFGDFKPSGYFYAILPFISVFGLNEWAVRLPSAIAGVLSVIGIGLLTSLLAEKLWIDQREEVGKYAALTGTGVATFSPWLIQFSRGGWEVNLASCLLLWAVIFGFQAQNHLSSRKVQFYILSAILAGLSMYVYHATRVIAPLLLLALFLSDWVRSFDRKKVRISQLWKMSWPFIIAGTLFLLIITPILLSSRNPATQQRFAETSLLSDGQYVKDSNAFREIAGANLLAKIFTHRYLIFAKEVAVAFLSHFTPDFLFVSGDANPRHSTGFTGILLLADALWLIIGIVFICYSAWKELHQER